MQVLGGGKDRTLFFTNSSVRSSFKAYVSMLVYRTNTVTGTTYRDDPTIMAWELQNEPHLWDSYESQRGAV